MGKNCTKVQFAKEKPTEEQINSIKKKQKEARIKAEIDNKSSTATSALSPDDLLNEIGAIKDLLNDEKISIDDHNDFFRRTLYKNALKNHISSTGTMSLTHDLLGLINKSQMITVKGLFEAMSHGKKIVPVIEEEPETE